ncbi:hypothetical protein ONV78_17885 [Hahella sp. CR1]|uniref:PD-(D/E)XK nuclease family protein n=1 Tax=Hahella sp. CR1 TaxID=2992807 RepID=UPI0024414881|nr:PD-(D/E)XK nuclease family protein [Hahella sp. CR1]MDG9669613.1 hypothetical protein [Hahella sp. CR1]
MFEIILLLIVSALIVIVCRVAYRLKNEDPLGIDGKLVWIDRGRQTKPFFNRSFGVFGKPDLIYRIARGFLAVEYKSRRGVIYESDIVQAKVAALAARGAGYRVTQVLVRTDATERYIDLPASDKELYNEVGIFIEIARQAKAGMKMPAKPNRAKCGACAYKLDCSQAHHH